MLTRRRAVQTLALAPALAAFADGSPRLVRLGPEGGPLAAYVAPERGGELAGLELRRGLGPGRELLYRGRDYAERPGWTGRAPVLWPATGRNLAAGDARQGDGAAGSWIWRGERRPMPIHGFARDLPWQVDRLDPGPGPHAITLSLGDDARTRAPYPFGFRLESRYAVCGLTLSIRQRVTASAGNATPMPFSIGDHITFALPLVPGGDARAVVVRTPARRRIALDDAGRPTGEVTASPFEATPVGRLAPRAAIALGGYAPGATWASLEDPAGLTVTVSHVADRWPPGEPVLFNLWGDAAAGFFSPEPWVGKQNSLASGDGVIAVRPGEAWTWTILVAVQPHAGVGRRC